MRTITRAKPTVRLPSDQLTKKQLEKMSGPVITYRFVPGVPAEELERWPADLREEYYKKFGR